MNRTAFLKFSYILIIGLCVLLIILIDSLHGHNLGYRLMLILLLFVPGQFSKAVFRNLYRGIALNAEKKYQESIAASEEFLIKIRSKPQIKPLLWLTWSVYTIDPEAMALNNIAVSYINLGEPHKAEEAAKLALSLDAQYPLPHFNLGVISVQSDKAKARAHFAEAIRLGYSGGTVDQVLSKIQSLYADSNHPTNKEPN